MREGLVRPLPWDLRACEVGLGPKLRENLWKAMQSRTGEELCLSSQSLAHVSPKVKDKEPNSDDPPTKDGH